ncbi:hypothetical protein KKH42_01455 [bacterium]|nr:hypothetical protein [bacterium]
MKKLNALIPFFCFAVFASADPGKSCFDFLDVPSSARSAVGPLVEGPAGAFANPALVGVEKTAMEFSYAKWYGNLNLTSAGFGQRVSDKFSLAVYAAVMNLSDPLKAYDNEGIPAGEAEYSNYRYAAALSFQPMASLKLGLAVITAGEDLDGDAQSAVLPSAGFEMKFRGGILRRAVSLFTNVSGEPDTSLSAWRTASLGKIDYNGDKFSPLSVSEVSVSENIGHLTLSIGARSSETSGFRAGMKYGFENIIMEGGILSEAESDILISAGVSFEFEPVTVDLSYLTRGDAGSSLYSTLKYEFDIPGFAGKISERIARKKKEAKSYVTAGNISELASSVSKTGEKEIWINFNSEISFSGNFVVSRDSKIIARGAITDCLSENPFVYEALIMGRDVIKDVRTGDVVAVSAQQIKKKQEQKITSSRKESDSLEKRIDGQRRLLKTADLMRWDSSSPRAILERVSALRIEGKLKECEEKMPVLENSVKKLFEDNIKAMIAEAGDLASDARKVGVNVSYPESLTLKAEAALKKKNYNESLGYISESLKWLNNILDDIENE